MGERVEVANGVTSKIKSTDDNELRPYASPPCYQHELDPLFQEQSHGDGWASVRHWRRLQRRQLLDRRQCLDSSELSQAAIAINRALKEEMRFVGDSVAFYWPLAGEVDLRPFMRTLLSCNIGVALPVVVKRDAPLEFWAWEESRPMQKHAIWNIPVPAERNVIFPSVLFVPLLGFDIQGHRLGHGGGYYDRTLAALDPRPLAVGVGHEFSRLPSIYPQEHDVPMDVIVTERGIDWHNR